MLEWSGWHPYNAVHGVRLPGFPDRERLRGAIGSTLEQWGLVGLEVDPSGRTCRFQGGGEEPELRSVGGPDAPEALLAAEVARQLNTPFPPAGRFDPFRFFLISGPESFWLGLAYFHVVADAESIVFLLQKVARVYVGTHGPDSSGRVDLYPRRPDHLVLRRPIVLARTVAALPAHIRNIRRSSRPSYQAPTDFNNGFALFSIPSAELRALMKAGKDWEVSFNDLVLALLLKSLSNLAPAGRRTDRRSRISVGTIVNIRKDLGLEGRPAFGVFLGSFIVTHEVPKGIGVKELALEIRERTLRVKRGKLYLGMSLELAAARLALRFFSTERGKKFYPKFFPLWGGVTNMNLNILWERPAGQLAPDYFRAVSTGPVTPLVLSVTTAGEVANVGLSYRTTVYSKAQIETFQSGFLAALKEGVGSA